MNSIDANSFYYCVKKYVENHNAEFKEDFCELAVRNNVCGIRRWMYFFPQPDERELLEINATMNLAKEIREYQQTQKIEQLKQNDLYLPFIKLLKHLKIEVDEIFN